MEGIAMMGFIFGMVGLIGFVNVMYLRKELKEKGVLDVDKKEEQITYKELFYST
jgi:hypothetical protein